MFFCPVLRHAMGALLFIFLPTALASAQQQTETISLPSMLQSLDSNRHEYHRSVPSFYCKEHLVSTFTESHISTPGRGDTIFEDNLDADSVFRVVRDPDPDGSSTLTESRRIVEERLNGRPVSSHKVEAPSILSGAFTGGLSLVSLSQQSCLTYTSHKRRRGLHVSYEIDFSTVPEEQRSIDCLLQEDATGHALVDPESLQITHLEIFVPYHLVIAQRLDGSYLPAAYGPWHVEITYAPITLNRVYSMPSEIYAKTVTSDMSWTFHTTYSDYHRLVVTSRILP